MKIIDTHQHLWDLDQFPYSWCKGIPKLNRSFLMSEYVEAVQEVNAVKSVHVEADVDEPYMLDETRHILSLSEQPDNPLSGVVACARPGKDGFAEYIEQIAGHPNLKGVRRVLHTQPDEVSQSALFVEHIRLLKQFNLSFDLCVLARQLPIATDLVRQCPGVSFVLDHCGVPDVKGKALDPWREHIKQIAEFQNVVCKVSGLVAYANPDYWSPDDLRPFIEHVIECFGWDRVMFGSDWPVCTLSATFKEWADAAMFLTKDASQTERSKLFYENAERVYRLG